jgi:hypothetical protein
MKLLPVLLTGAMILFSTPVFSADRYYLENGCRNLYTQTLNMFLNKNFTSCFKDTTPNFEELKKNANHLDASRFHFQIDKFPKDDILTKYELEYFKKSGCDFFEKNNFNIN